MVLTNEAQPPPFLATDSGLKLTILQRNVGQKWLGCMLTAARTQLQHIDLECHLHQASIFFSRKPVDFAGPKCIHFQTLKIFRCRGFICRMFWRRAGTGQFTTPSWPLWMFRPPPEVDWNAAWKEVLHLWNERVRNFIANAHVNTWSYITCKNYWNLARHVAGLPAHRWVQRLLSWHPFGTRRVGRPRHTWESKLHAYCRYADLGSWRELDDVVWNSLLASFVNFCRM